MPLPDKLPTLSLQVSIDTLWRRLVSHYTEFPPFLAENHGLRLVGPNSHSSCFTLSCKPLQYELEAAG